LHSISPQKPFVNIFCKLLYIRVQAPSFSQLTELSIRV